MTTRIIITPQDIIARFKPSDPPEDFEKLFGPIGLREQKHPFKYDSFKPQKYGKLPGPMARGHPQQQPNKNPRQQNHQKSENNQTQNIQNQSQQDPNNMGGGQY